MDWSDDELGALYARYSGVIYQRCLSILRDSAAADDAVQETFAKVITRRDQFRADSSPLTWMYRIATNHCLNQIRNGKTRRRKLDDHQAEIAGPPTSIPELGASVDQERMLDILADADEQTRAVVLHTYFEDCTRAETARRVGISVPTVRKRLTQFLDTARRQLGAALLVLSSLAPLAWSS